MTILIVFAVIALIGLGFGRALLRVSLAVGGVVTLLFFIWLHNDQPPGCEEPNPFLRPLSCPSQPGDIGAPSPAQASQASPADPYQKSLQTLAGEKLAPLN